MSYGHKLNECRFGMRLWCDLVNVYTNPVNVYTNVASDDEGLAVASIAHGDPSSLPACTTTTMRPHALRLGALCAVNLDR